MKLTPTYSWQKTVRTQGLFYNEFFKRPWAQGAVLIICVAVAMLLANLPFTKDFYHSVLETDFFLCFQTPGGERRMFPRDMTVESFINDILMTVFFFTVGLEIRREMKTGELSSPKKALMPVIAALGGVLAPAVIFCCVNAGTSAASGWGIPTATDIAFAVGILSILGDRVPLSLKVFLTALAIADDLIAILVVAFFYGGQINPGLLCVALLLILFGVVANRFGEKRGIFYLVPALAIWTLFYYSGIHATMSGVVMAFLVPMAPRYSESYFRAKSRRCYRRLSECEDGPFPNGRQRHYLRKIARVSNGSVSMSSRLEHKLSPIVNFVIMPLFALANAGVEIADPSYLKIFSFDALTGGVGLGIFLGLVIGKPLGISLASFLALKLGVGQMPSNASWKMLIAVACLGGIGFTMSIFVDTLSFSDQSPEVMQQLRDMGKVAVLMASLAAGLLGALLINIVSGLEKKRARGPMIRVGSRSRDSKRV